MIVSFGDKATEALYHGRPSRQARQLPPDVVRVALRRLDMINAAHTLGDLRSPPGNRLEALKGDRAGRWSMRVNDQYRVTFRFEDGHAYEVSCEDYH